MLPSKSFGCLVLLCAILLSAQDAPKTITLTDKSNVAADDIVKRLQKECPNVTIANDPSKADYSLEAIKKTTRTGLDIQHVNEFYLTLFDRDDNTFSAVTNESLSHTLKDLCRAIKTAVMVEIVDTKNLTQSVDVRGEGPGVVDAAANSATGRRTHTDSSTIYVIVHGEHALLDCYERRTGCSTIAPGKYYGERKGDGIWVSYRMPITHEPMRNHYKIAGSW
ncbi:MAG: hypothetical protein WB799_17445 [Candidatus Sulfotelmatobacter sp.]